MASDFIRDRIAADLSANKHEGRVCTRFPPEPNGYLHIGHAKSICLNFGVAKEFGGVCHLRMDDTNPTTEDPEYEQLYELGERLIRKGRAYVCHLTEDEMGAYRGTISEPGKNSPYRTRSTEENLDLFRRMKKGEFKDSECVLRAKIDMASPNMKLRDPPLYRIKHENHYRTGNTWCMYPLYDFAH